MGELHKLSLEEFKLLNKINALALLINNRTKYCVFVRYSGHVDNIDISISESKSYYNNKVAEAIIELYPSGWGNKTLVERYEEVIETLEHFLQDDKIPYDYLHEVERIEYDYKF